MTEATNPVVLVVQSILGGEGTAYSYKDNFSQLWNYVNNPEGIVNIKRIVLVADGLPTAKTVDEVESVNDGEFAKWVSGYSFSVALVAACQQEKINIPEILILDLESGTKSSVSLLDEFESHLKCFCSARYAEDDFFIDAFCGALKKTTKPGEFKEVNNAISAYWNKLRCKFAPESDSSESKHDVSNHIGAMIMRTGLPKPLRPQWRQEAGKFERATSYLVERLLAVDDSSESDQIYPLMKQESVLIPTGSSLFDTPKIMLVDDHQNYGYRDVLQAALLGTGSVDQLIGRRGVFSDKINDLDAASVNPKKLLGMSFSETTHLSAFVDLDLIFLDLRLWKSGDKEKTLSMYSDVLKTIPCDTKIYELHQKNNSHRPLAMLPLIINELDPSLPIVLFSSTQHRSVIQAVRDCPSIITAFSKPYLGGDDPDTVDPQIVMADLRRAFFEAMGLVAVRQVWKHAVIQWSDCIFNELKWSSDEWPPINVAVIPEDLRPVSWIRKTWLPLAQRKEYALAATLPMIYLRQILGDSRLQILESNAVKQHDCLKLIRSSYSLFPRREPNPPALDCEIAIATAMALIELLAHWSPKKNKQ